MGRSHHVKLPERYYLTPPTTPPPSQPLSSLPFASSLLSVRSAVYPPVSSALFQDAYGARARVSEASDRIPGFKTSAAFFTTLRANLTIDLDSPPPSCCSTPVLRASNTWPLTNNLPPLPSPLVYDSDMDDDSIAETQDVTGVVTDADSSQSPPLTTTAVTSEDDKVEVLHLVADSVAQQRQYASSAILSNPITIASLVAVLGILHKFLPHESLVEWALVATTFTGVFMTLLVAIRLLTKDYIEEAESVGTWKWLDKDRADNTHIANTSDDLILSRYGTIPIGALVLRGIHTSAPSRRGGTAHSRTNSRRQGSNSKNSLNQPVTGTIRGFTVKNRYRRKGVGTELLEEAVKLCQDRGWAGPEFDKEHANSKRVLPSWFNGPFDRRAKKAKVMLGRVKREMGVPGAEEEEVVIVQSKSGGKKKSR